MTTRRTVRADDREWTVEVDGLAATIDGARPAHVIAQEADGHLRVAHGTDVVTGVAALDEDHVWVGIDGYVVRFTIGPPESANRADDDAKGPRSARASRAAAAITPPMPATVVRIMVKAGDSVHAGDTLVVLEAMKMELPVRAPHDAMVVSVNCREGELVQPDTVLIELK